MSRPAGIWAAASVLLLHAAAFAAPQVALDARLTANGAKGLVTMSLAGGEPVRGLSTDLIFEPRALAVGDPTIGCSFMNLPPGCLTSRTRLCSGRGRACRSDTDCPSAESCNVVRLGVACEQDIPATAVGRCRFARRGGSASQRIRNFCDAADAAGNSIAGVRCVDANVRARSSLGAQRTSSASRGTRIGDINNDRRPQSEDPGATPTAPPASTPTPTATATAFPAD